MLRFIVALSALTLAIIGAVQGAFQLGWLAVLPSFFYQTTIFLVFSTSVIYYYLYKIEKPEVFVQLYLLTMAVKLLAYGAYMYFVITADKANAMSNVVFFLISYLLFTVLEIAFLFHKKSTKHTG